MKKLSILTVVFATIVVVLLTVSLDGNAQSEAKVRKIITEHNADFIRWFNTGQVDSLLSNYSEEACVLGQGCGKSFIREHYQSQMGLFQFDGLTISSISVSKSIAMEKGRWVIRLASGITARGEYQTEWHRKDRKTWQIVNEISTPD